MRTTMNFTLLSAILCILSWISVSRCEYHVVEVQTGEEVTLLCTNYTSSLSYISWFRLENGSNTSHISSMFSLDTGASYFDGIEKEKFSMTSNVSNVFLQMKQVDLLDSGLYICGFNVDRDSRNFPAVYSATYLKVKDEVDWLVVFLSATSAITTLLSVLLAFSICMMRVTDPHAPSSKINAKDEQNEDDPCYIAHREIQMNRSRGQRDDTWSECVYLSVRQ
ncbi:novel immune-type receptor 7b isoform X3 [Hippoglossus stenolepis]|uniref:novel immune-type receptor 7b isoform X3 n=1 Tax=Hippoglossus stenolepis TaxID=195615 RepID=UPI001FB0308E|nr:novel immune-type receptor 7b isoform X3 [Hippoglossus stenolepis]